MGANLKPLKYSKRTVLYEGRSFKLTIIPDSDIVIPDSDIVIPDLIRDPVLLAWIPAFPPEAGLSAGMTVLSH